MALQEHTISMVATPPSVMRKMVVGPGGLLASSFGSSGLRALQSALLCKKLTITGTISRETFLTNGCDALCGVSSGLRVKLEILGQNKLETKIRGFKVYRPSLASGGCVGSALLEGSRSPTLSFVPAMLEVLCKSLASRQQV